MLKRILIVGLSICMLFGITACSQNNTKKDGVQIKDINDKDITANVIELWENANNAYNVDNTELFDVDMGAPELLFEDAPAFFALSNYDTVMDDIFSAKGKKQFEETTIGGPYSLIQRQNGKVYKMGPWKTGVYFGEDLTAVNVKELSNDKIIMTMTYSAKNMDRRIDGVADFTIIKVNDKWLVDDYVYPEASVSTSNGASKVSYTEAELPKNSPENQAYVDNYIYPFAVTGLFRLNFSPSDMSELLTTEPVPPLRTIFNAFYNHDYPNGELSLTDLETDVTQDIFEGTLMNHLNLTAEEIRKSCAQFYNKDTKIYTSPFGLGGVVGVFNITNSTKEETKLNLTYNVYAMDYESPIADDGYPWILYAEGTLQMEVDGENYKYISNKIYFVEN